MHLSAIFCNWFACFTGGKLCPGCAVFINYYKEIKLRYHTHADSERINLQEAGFPPDFKMLIPLTAGIADVIR